MSTNIASKIVSSTKSVRQSYSHLPRKVRRMIYSLMTLGKEVKSVRVGDVTFSPCVIPFQNVNFSVSQPQSVPPYEVKVCQPPIDPAAQLENGEVLLQEQENPEENDLEYEEEEAVQLDNLDVHEINRKLWDMKSSYSGNQGVLLLLDGQKSFFDKYSVVLQRPMGWEVTVSTAQDLTWEIERESVFKRAVVKDAVGGLLGGARGRGGNRSRGRGKGNRNKKRKRKPHMNALIQEGAINVATPKDSTFRSTMTFNGTLVSDSSGTVEARFSLRNPQRAFNGSGTYVGAADFATLFDEYKIVQWQGRFTPLFAVGSSAAGFYNMAVDYDSEDTANQNTSNISEYTEFKMVDSRKAFEFLAKVPVLTEGIYAPIGADPEPAIIHQGGFMDYARPPNNGCVFIAGQGFPPNTIVTKFYLVMVVVNRRKR